MSKTLRALHITHLINALQQFSHKHFSGLIIFAVEVHQDLSIATQKKTGQVFPTLLSCALLRAHNKKILVLCLIPIWSNCMILVMRNLTKEEVKGRHYLTVQLGVQLNTMSIIWKKSQMSYKNTIELVKASSTGLQSLL